MTDSRELNKRAARVRAYHASCVTAARDQLGFAFLCGVELSAAKAALPHGQFIPWADKALPDVSKGARDNYRKFASLLAAKFPSVGNLTTRLLASGGKLANNEKRDLLAAIHEAADGKTISDFYRDLGLLKAPEKTATAPAKMSAKDKEAAEVKAAAEICDGALTSLDLLFATEGALLLRLDKDRLAALEAARLRLGELLPGRKKRC